jgi:hypothetical protein
VVGYDFFFFLAVLDFELRTYRPLATPFYFMGFFMIGPLELFAPGWLQTTILLISAS